MKTKARLIKALLDQKLLQDRDTIKTAKLGADELSLLDGGVLVLVKRRKKKEKVRSIFSIPHGISHFIFSYGKTSFVFVSKDRTRVEAIADFIVDDFDHEEEQNAKVIDSDGQEVNGG